MKDAILNFPRLTRAHQQTLSTRRMVIKSQDQRTNPQYQVPITQSELSFKITDLKRYEKEILRSQEKKQYK